MRTILLGLAALFVVALAVVIGKQMSADAMTMAVGIVVGIGASIPTALLMLFLMNRRRAPGESQAPPAASYGTYIGGDVTINQYGYGATSGLDDGEPSYRLPYQLPAAGPLYQLPRASTWRMPADDVVDGEIVERKQLCASTRTRSAR